MLSYEPVIVWGGPQTPLTEARTEQPEHWPGTGARAGTPRASPPCRSWCRPPLPSPANPLPAAPKGTGQAPPLAAGQRSPQPDPIPPSVPPGGSPASHSHPRSRAGRSRAAGARSSRDPPPPWRCGTGASAPGCPCSPGRHPGPAVSAREAPVSLRSRRKTCPAEGAGMLRPRQQAAVTPSSPQARVISATLL